MSNGEIIVNILILLPMLVMTFYNVYLGVKEKDFVNFIFAFVSFALFTVWTYGFIKKIYGL